MKLLYAHIMQCKNICTYYDYELMINEIPFLLRYSQLVKKKELYMIQQTKYLAHIWREGYFHARKIYKIKLVS